MHWTASPLWLARCLRSWLGAARVAVVISALLPAWAQVPAPPLTRVALVIGNASYPSAPLSNPGNDAKAVADALKRVGFSVIELRDANKAEMELGIEQTRQALQGRSGVGMLFYAGHGLQLDWHNYLVPVDARLSSARDVARQTIDVQQVLDAFKAAGTVMNIVVLDACRDNPFGATGRGAGLAAMDAQGGTFLAYATAPGNLAEDGANDNSLYSQHLVQELALPNARIEDVFKRVRLQVRQRTQGRQIPWESTSLEDEFYFDRGLLVAAPADQRSKELAFNREKADWDRVSAASNVDDLYAFLKRYPSGSISELAQVRLAQLQAPKITPAPDRDGAVPPDWRSRFREGDRFAFTFTDGLTGVVQRRGSMRVRITANDEVEGVGDGTGPLAGQVTMRSTRAGFQIVDGRGSYDPPWPLLPGGNLRVGEKWHARTVRTTPDGSKMWLDIEGRVLARERVTLPFGTIDSYKVEIQAVEQSGSRGKWTLWFDPVWGPAVKVLTEWRNPRGAPDITLREMSSRVRGN